MNTQLLILACVAVCALSAPNGNERRCWTSGNNQGARYWDEGSRVDRGKFWYECRNGELEPMGCFSDTKERLYLLGTYITGGYEKQCVLGDDGYLKFEYTACSPDGVSRHQPGQTWEDDRQMYYYECRKSGEFLRSEIAGCLSHDKTRRVKLGQKYDDGEFVYECRIKETGAAQMCSVGCMHNGHRYEIGQQWNEGDYVYYCKSENGRCSKQCVGCQFQNKRLYDGDRYTKADTVYQCEIRPTDQKHKPVACSVRDYHGDKVERKIGCRWFQETRDSKVEVTCEQEGQDNTKVVTLGCIYVKDGYDTLFVKPGTYTLWTQTMDEPAKAIACKDMGNGQYRLETFAVEEVASRAFGLNYDSPRG